MNRTLRVLVADDERDMREYLEQLVARLGHQAAGAANGRQLLELCRRVEPDLVITDIKMPDMDGIAVAEAVNQERETPIILVSAHHDAALLARASRKNIMGYLIKPVGPADVEAAIVVAMARFDQYQETSREAISLKQALQERKLIERAKGIVMKRLGTDEDDAFRRLRKLASDGNLKLSAAARRVLEAEEVFQQVAEADEAGWQKKAHGLEAPNVAGGE
jgi:AmiR/NasT family two-component response regulator